MASSFWSEKLCASKMRMWYWGNRLWNSSGLTIFLMQLIYLERESLFKIFTSSAIISSRAFKAYSLLLIFKASWYICRRYIFASGASKYISARFLHIWIFWGEEFVDFRRCMRLSLGCCDAFIVKHSEGIIINMISSRCRMAYFVLFACKSTIFFIKSS